MKIFTKDRLVAAAIGFVVGMFWFQITGYVHGLFQ
jgi:hypothetical protein